MLFIALWFFIVIISFWLFKLSAGSMSPLKPNLLSITFYYSLFVSSYIGSLLIVLDIDKHYMIRLLSDEHFRLQGFIMISIIMVLLPLTMFLVNKLAGFDAEKEANFYLASPIKKEESLNTYYFYMYAGMTILSCLAVAYTIYHLKTIPVFALLQKGSNLEQLRIEASHGFSGNAIIRNVLGIHLAPILSMITFIYAHKTQEIKWKTLFIISSSCAVFMQVYTLAKGPIFFYLLMFVLLLIYMGIIRMTWIKVGGYGLFAVVALVFMYIYIQGVTDINQFFSYQSGPVGRLILSQIAPFYLHLEHFSLNDLGQFRSAREVMMAYFPQRVEEGTAGVLNTLYAGEAFAHFGYAGIIIGTIYIGVYIQLFYIIFTRLPKNPLFLALFVYFSINIPRTVIGGFTDFLLNTLWLGILIIVLSPYLLIQLMLVFKKYKEQSGKMKETVN